jgi:hypothetical protein
MITTKLNFLCSETRKVAIRNEHDLIGRAPTTYKFGILGIPRADNKFKVSKLGKSGGEQSISQTNTEQT